MSRVVLSVLLFCALALPAHAQVAREVTANARSIVSVSTKLRFTTVIVLPDGEEILDFVCGDRDLWVVSGTQNLAYVKPAKARASTNLNLVTASGQIYSFLLTEGGPEPDLKVYVTPDERSTVEVPRLYTAGQVEALRRDAAAARQDAEDARDEVAKALEATATARKAADEAVRTEIARFRASYPERLVFPYRFKAVGRPLDVVAMFHDGQFTYIRTLGTDMPTLHELQDGKPSLVSFQVEGGAYIVPKVLAQGYLLLGKRRLEFETVR